MSRQGLIASLVLAHALTALPVQSEPATKSVTAAREVERDSVNPPFGYVDYCKREPEQCRRWTGRPEALTPTPMDWTTLNDVNTRINLHITALTDQLHYGVKEFWTLPDKAGDCEDFVLLKQRVLTDLGFPPNSLLITVVRDEKGEGHAVLTFASTEGDFILDNRRNDIRRWDRANYTFLKRQSASDPDRWVSLADDASQAVVASARMAESP